MIALGRILIWNAVLIGALGFIAGIALEDMMIMIGSVLFTCVAALVVFGPGN
jgi:hypothetical protein